MHKAFIIVTGGNADRCNPEAGQTPPEDLKQAPTLQLLSRMEEEQNMPNGYDVHVPFLKDSRSVTDEDRAEILRLAQTATDEHDIIIVTHGSFTASALACNLAGELSKPVVILCANRPSDGDDPDLEEMIIQATDYLYDLIKPGQVSIIVSGVAT